MRDSPSDSAHGPAPREFATTQWSMVLAAGNAGGRAARREALSQLCETYWYPLYAYVRRRVGSQAEAEDVTQAFFSHLLEKDAVAKAKPERGRFRAFLLTSLKNFLVNEREKARAEKRGGGKLHFSFDFADGDSRFRCEPVDRLTPEMLYERRWVLTLLEQVLENLRQELASRGREQHFEQFKDHLTGEVAAADYEQAAAALKITPSAAKQAAYRLRKRYSELLRAEVARTVAGEDEVDDEIGRLLAILAE